MRSITVKEAEEVRKLLWAASEHLSMNDMHFVPQALLWVCKAQDILFGEPKEPRASDERKLHIK